MVRRIDNRFANFLVILSIVTIVLPTALAHGVFAQTRALFQPAVTYGSVGGLPAYLTVTDLNGDKIVDLLVAGDAGDNTGAIGILSGSGNGALQAVGVTYSSETQADSQPVIADVNGDGKPDIVVVGTCAVWLTNCVQGETLVSVLLGNGDATFQSARLFKTGAHDFAFSLAVADVNGDGKLDLAVADLHCGSTGFDGCVSVLLGNGDGTFQAAKVYGSGGLDAQQIAIADVNGDGKPDLVVANAGGAPSTVGVLLGNGDGTFQPATSYDSGGGVAFGLVVTDLNHDHRLDLVVTNVYSDNISVLIGNGDGTFQAAIPYASGGQGIVSMALTDVNGDGQPDLVVGNCGAVFGACPGNGVVTGLLGKSDGTFHPAVPIDIEPFPNAPQSVALADVNGDGRPDLLVTRFAAGTVDVLLGNGDGSFQPAVFYDSGVFRTRGITVADLNGDGSQDVVVPGNDAFGSGIIGVLLNNTPADIIPPLITVSASPRILWPPNGRMVPVRVSGRITDTGSGVNAATATYTVKDEYHEVQPSGPISLGSGGTYSFVVLLQASRRGWDLDGRHYAITVRAKDNVGNSGSKSTAVVVPQHRE